MSQNCKQKLISKLFPILLVALGAAVYFGMNMYWPSVCPGDKCTYYFRNGFFRPLMESGLMIVYLAAPFLLLPKHYFTAWCKWLALPIIAITTLVVTQGPVAQTQAGIFILHRADVVELLTWFWFALTLLFIAVHYKRSHH